MSTRITQLGADAEVVVSNNARITQLGADVEMDVTNNSRITLLGAEVEILLLNPVHGLSNYTKDALCNHLFRTASLAKPLALYLALYTMPPALDGTGGTEVSAPSYRRKLVTPDDGHFTPPTSGNGTTTNGDDIVFNTPLESWGTCSAWAVWDAETGGNMLALSTFSGPVAVAAGSNPRLVAGALSVQIDT